MAKRPSTMAFEDVPLDEARRMSCGPRVDPELYHALKEKIQSLDTTATRMPLPEDTSPTMMKNRILRTATDLNVPVTVRKVPGNLIFWRSTAEELQQTQQIAARLHTARQPPRGAHPRRRRRG